MNTSSRGAAPAVVVALAVLVSGCCGRSTADTAPAAAPSGSASGGDVPSKPVTVLPPRPLTKPRAVLLAGARQKLSVSVPSEWRPDKRNTRDWARFDLGDAHIIVLDKYEGMTRLPEDDLRAGLADSAVTGVAMSGIKGQVGVLKVFRVSGDEVMSWNATPDSGKDGYGHQLHISMGAPRGKLDQQLFFDILATAKAE